MAFGQLKIKTTAPSMTLANRKKNVFQNVFEFFTYYGAEFCPKHDVEFRFSLNKQFSRDYMLKFKKMHFFAVTCFITLNKKNEFIAKNILKFKHLLELKCVLNTIMS